MASETAVYAELIGDVDTPAYPCITVEVGTGSTAVYGVKRYPVTYRFYETSAEGTADEPTDTQQDILEARTDQEAEDAAVNAASGWWPLGVSNHPVTESNYKSGTYVAGN